MSSAKELLRFSFDAVVFGRRAFNASDSQSTLDRLSDRLTEIENRHRAGMRKGASPEDIQQIYRRYIQTSKTGGFRRDFTNRSSARKLAWALTYSENQPPYDQSIVSNTGQLENALKIIEGHFSASALLGVFDALLQVWDKTNAGLLRTFLRKRLTSYGGRRRFLQKLKANNTYYCDEDGAAQLAVILHRDQKNMADVWTYLELPDHTRGYTYFGMVAEAYVTRNNRIGRPFVEDIVRFVGRHDNDENRRVLLSQLIERLGNDASERLREPVQTYVLREWQDPRFNDSAVHWRYVSDNAKSIFERWITREDLRLFFDVVAKACNDAKFKYRKDFWMSYLEHISFCRPVLRNDVDYIFKKDPKALQYYRTRRPAILKRGTQNQHAFIIQMGEYTFVEFSTAGACHVYRNADRSFWIGASEYYMGQLRNRERAVHRVIHSGSEGYAWQRRFRDWIGRNLQIRQTGKYSIEDNSRYL